MKQFKTNKLHTVLGIILTALVLLTGIMLIIACLDIYFSSERDPYSPATIAQAFRKINTVVWITVAGIVGGIAADLTSSEKKKRPKAIVQEEIILRKLHGKLPTLTGAAASNPAHFRRQRILLAVAACAVCAALMIYPCIYFSDPSHFTVAALNADIVKAVLTVMIPATLALLCFFAAGILIRKSLQKEIAFYKQLLSEVPQKAIPATADHAPKKKWFLWCIRGSILLLAAVLIAAGIGNGGAQDVLKKAIAICTECIGLG